MPFFKDLRRRSKAGFRQDNASDESKTGSVNAPTTRSTSTLNSSSTAPTTLSHSLSSLTLSKLGGTVSPKNGSNGSKTPPGISSPVSPQQRPSPVPAQGNKRYSMTVSYHPTPTMAFLTSLFPQGSFSSTTTPLNRVPESLYAPKILSVSENSWVRNKNLLQARVD